MDNLFNASPDSATAGTAMPATDSTGSSVPNYLLAADNHNIGNTLGGSWFDPSTWETKFENSGKFIATSVLSGADSIYNTAATVGSWAGMDTEAHDTKEFISGVSAAVGLDDDLGQYYAQNRTAVDLVGFIATSFIPGMGGIKFLNAGQTALKGAMKSGMIGGNLAKATGLLVPETEMYVKLAARDIVQSSGAISSLKVNTVKALGSGVYQNILEAAAFETAVQATMSKSPILDGQDNWDIAKNIAFGGLLGGAIGGAIGGAQSLGSIKRLAGEELTSLRGASSRVQPLDATPAGQKIILAAEDRDTVFTAPARTDSSVLSQEEANIQAAKLAVSKTERANNYIRTEVNGLVKGGDGTVGNMVADALHGTSAQDLMNSVLHLDEIGTLGTNTKVDSLYRKAVGAKDIGALNPLETRYVKLTGESAGTVTDAAPLVANIADTVTTSGKISVKDAVMKVVRGYKFKAGDEWDATALTGTGAHTEAEARYIWANNLDSIKPDTVIHANDIPLLERIYADSVSGTSTAYKMKYPEGSTDTGLLGKPLLDHLTKTKSDVANDLLQQMVLKGNMPVESGTAAIAKIVNMKQAALEGTKNLADPTSYLFAKQAADAAHQKMLVSKGLRSAAEDAQDTAFMPQYGKLAYQTKPLVDTNGNALNAMAWIKTQQKLYQDAADRVFAKNAGDDLASRAMPISDSVLLNANLKDGGAGLFSFANGGYGSLGSFMQQLGANVTRPLKDSFRALTTEAFTGPLVAMGSKREAAMEWDIVSNKIASTTEHYVADHEGFSGVPRALISKKIRDYQLAMQEGGEAASNLATPVLQKGAPEFIPIQNQETYDAMLAHIQRTGDRQATRSEINAVAGMEDNKATDIFRPIPPNTNDYPFIAFVKDDKITGAGHTTMIHAASQKELEALASKVPTDSGYSVIYKNQAEDYYKARSEFEYSRTLHENYIDSDLKSRGINSQFFTKTDPQKIIDDILQSHLRQDDVTAVELMRMKYQPTFDWLEDQGKQFSQIESSRYGNALSNVEKYGKNPFTDYTKTALDVSKASEYTLLHSANRALDSAVSAVYGQVSKLWDVATKPSELEAINGILEKYGINNAYKDAATVALADHAAPKGVLSKFIRTSNALLSKFTLALDPLNGLINALGANILRSTETKQLVDAINAADPKIAGALVGISRIGVPGTTDTIFSTTKLLATALKNFVQDDGTLMAQYANEGLVKTSLQQFKGIMDDFTLRGTETAVDLDTRLTSAFSRAKEMMNTGMQKGEVVTGNKFFEQYNRFLSANVMHQLTDAGEAAGVLTPAESMAYRNTFVNRVEANTIASQRPVMFQGPIGQAVGLFQSYQFNLMQQMFRYVGEGTGKDAAMLLGLQGTMYGINGMPAFNAINTHIIGNLSGNTAHKDLYDATYSVADKTAGDFLMYGIPSSVIQTNLYSRGDINPRQLTIIPSSFKDIPIVSGYSNLLGGIKNTLTNISGGGNVWESILQGLEHNGISRPLAGLAQTLQSTTGNGQAFSTSKKGTIIGSNDFLSLATLSRLSGGRPLDEAIVNDGMYRIQAYEASQKVARDNLTEAVKTTGIQGQTASPDQLAQFAQEYAATGGKQVNFNKYVMSSYKSANTTQAEHLSQQLSSPFLQKVQGLMGGRLVMSTPAPQSTNE